jgi:methyl-accepting chemotaxis protein
MLVNKKLLFNTILLIGIILVILSSCIVFSSKLILKNILTKKYNEQFSIIKDFKKKELEVFFSNLKKEIILLSQEPLVKSSFDEFNFVVTNQLEQDSLYSKYHSYFEKVAKNSYYNYKDILLLDFNGNIIYNREKSFRFIPSIQSNPLVDKEIANIFNIISNHKDSENYVAVSNFTEFSMNHAEPLVFLATKVANSGVLIVSLGISKLKSLLTLSEQLHHLQIETTLSLIDQELNLIKKDGFGKCINKFQNIKVKNIKEYINLYKNDFLEIKDSNKEVKISYFTPIEGTIFILMLQAPKTAVLRELSLFFKYTVYISIIIIPLLLLLTYSCCLFSFKKAGKKINKINDFVQIVIEKKELDRRIDVTDSSNQVADIINNMLSWFQDTLGKVAFKIRSFIDQYNSLLNSINVVANNVKKGRSLIEDTKNSINQVLTEYNNLQKKDIEYQDFFNQHQKYCLDLLNLNSSVNKFMCTKDLSSAIEDVLNICNLANLLSIQVSLESKGRNRQGRNFFILTKEIKQMTDRLKAQLLKIKNCLADYQVEHDLLRDYFNSIKNQTNLIAESIGKLNELQKNNSIYTTTKINQINISQANILELETKYTVFLEQILNIIDNNVKLNPEADLDDYYHIKIIENENN